MKDERFEDFLINKMAIIYKYLIKRKLQNPLNFQIFYWIIL
jgi:hypothetical protein